MKKICWILFYCLLILNLRAQIIHSDISSKYIESGVYSTHFINPFSFTANPAILASQQKIAAGLYSEKIFLIQEISYSSLAVSFPSYAGGIGVQANYFGFTEFNDMQAGVAYAKKLAQTVELGIQVHYNSIHIAGYGNANAIGFDVGMMLHPSEKINIGMRVSNPMGGKFGKNANEKLATVCILGIGYEASQEVFVSFELNKEESRPLDVTAALQYILAKQFFAQIGIESASASPYAGIGLSWKDFRVDISTSYHPDLGFSPALLLIFKLEK